MAQAGQCRLLLHPLSRPPLITVNTRATRTPVPVFTRLQPIFIRLGMNPVVPLVAEAVHQSIRRLTSGKASRHGRQKVICGQVAQRVKLAQQPHQRRLLTVFLLNWAAHRLRPLTNRPQFLDNKSRAVLVVMFLFPTGTIRLRLVVDIISTTTTGITLVKCHLGTIHRSHHPTSVITRPTQISFTAMASRPAPGQQTKSRSQQA